MYFLFSGFRFCQVHHTKGVSVSNIVALNSKKNQAYENRAKNFDFFLNVKKTIKIYLLFRKVNYIFYFSKTFN